MDLTNNTIPIIALPSRMAATTSGFSPFIAASASIWASVCSASEISASGLCLGPQWKARALEITAREMTRSSISGSSSRLRCAPAPPARADDSLIKEQI